MQSIPRFSNAKQPISYPTIATGDSQKEKDLAGNLFDAGQPLDLDTIFKDTTTEVRQLLNIDRVSIFRFYSDTSWHGEFIVEAVVEGCGSLLTEECYEYFGDGQVQYHLGHVEAVADIYTADLSPQHVDILEQLQVRASLAVPILKYQSLWGILCLHHCQSPRLWSAEEIGLVQQIVERLKDSVQQTENFSQSYSQTKVFSNNINREKAIAKTISKIRQSLDISVLFQSVTTEIKQLLEADRVAIFQFTPDQDWEGEFVSEDVSEDWRSVLTQRVYEHSFETQFADQYDERQVQIITDIYTTQLSGDYINVLERFEVRASLAVPISQGEQLWGLLCVHQCEHVRHWSLDDIKFVQKIVEYLSFALQQLKLLEQLRYQTEQQKSLTGVITRIRESLDLETIFQTTAQEVRHLLKADQVGIFFFQNEQYWEGQFVAEDCGEGISSILEEKVYDRHFGERYAPLYQEGRMYISHNIFEGDIQNDDVQKLERLGIKANVVSPIMNGDELWGLLCIHHCQGPRQWQLSEIEFIDQIAKHLGVALEQWSQVEQLRLQAAQLAHVSSRELALEQQQLLSQTINAIRDSLQIEEIFDTTTKSIQSLFKTDRVVIYQFNADWSGQFVAESVADGWPVLVGSQGINQDPYLMETQGGRYARQETLAVDDIYQTDYKAHHMRLLADSDARAYMIVPIMEGNRLWGLLAACQNSRPRHWETDEIDFLAQVSTQLGVALNQAEAVARVRDQAAALQKATDRQRALTMTIDKIRQSLDIDIIFTTTTQEVRQLLEVDRVAIYRFNADWSGAFVADSIVDGWQPAVPNQAIIQDVFSRPDQDGQLPRNEVFVPISQGEKLWGLLVAYQTSKPRYWDDDEVGLLAQVGTQLGIALQQAELLRKTQQQTAKLNQTLETLKSTQARLVQGEKMAGLGQLAAGIAHEINNPVGFISSNLEPMQNYITGLLELLTLYQQHYPEPEQLIQNKIDDIEVDFILEDLPKIMASMKMGTNRIVDIVQSMQNFSRVDEAAIKDVDIHQGIDSALLILKHRLKACKQRPTINVVKYYGELPTIHCYASHLNQVFMNILVNAVDAFDDLEHYHGQMPEIEISTRWQESQNTLVVEISDNGRGIPEDVLASIFNPFFTTKPVGKGTGLGLSISYQIVTEMHGGKLYCQSTVGQGTNFCIEIPLTIAEKIGS
ncbi:GAF domain-containing protein [Leptolyngbyaceae cyanobacterium CCMR0082]|uniref:histidine kinase n=1 Tax=Adonisia turfae CCMR0082 TaxID=2304604 RepID=A0A6M0S9F6_9CYAN|nr:GAF domain-containing protein [Adonisia turfae]NEZ65114.1 GAF domain-containing protein [Adonisia turfae CCMR0082]